MARLITDFESALPTLSKAVFSQPIDKTDYTKVSIRPVMLRGQLQYQLERFQDNKAYHQNVSGEELLKIAAKTVHSARYITFKLCSSCPYKDEFYETLENIRGLQPQLE